METGRVARRPQYREAAGEGTGDAPPTDAPAPTDPADVPLDRFFTRF